MAGDFPRRAYVTPEGQNPEGQNPGNNAGGSSAPKSEVPRRTDKEPMLPKDLANQDYTGGGNDEGDYDESNYPITGKEEVEILRQRLAESDRANLELAR